MAAEKRRIVYELLVEAVGAKKAKEALTDVSSGMKGLAQIAAKVGPMIAGALTVRGVAQALDDMTRFNQQLETLGVTGKEAAEGLHSVQSIALATGQSMDGVAKAYAEAVDLQQVLGRSTQMAADTTEAFTRIAAAEGKTAQEAAAQIEMLGFALDSGVLKSKEFAAYLKTSNTFQKAAQEALGKTTAELVDMAKKSDLTGVELTKIILKMEEIGRSKSAAVTVDGLTNSFKTLFATLVQGFAKGAGFDAKAADIVDPDLPTTMKKVSDSMEGVGKEIGGLTGIATNSIQRVYRELSLLGRDVFGTETATENWKKYKQEVDADMAEMAASYQQLWEGMIQGTTSDPNYGKAAIARKKEQRERENQAALAKAEARTIQNQMDEARAKNDKRAKAASEARKKQLAEEAKERDRINEKAAKEREDQQIAMRMDAQRAYEKSMEDAARATGMLVDAFGEDDIATILEDLASGPVPEFTESVLDSFSEIEAARAVLENAFADLFTGATHTARDFFAQVLQGLANIFAQLAALQAQEAITGWMDTILGGMNWGSSSKSTGNLQGSLLDNIRGYNAAKGRAFHHGQVIPFARGGVVNGPTVFPMARGYGLMGEAGPEAVLPLKRTSSGRLGVSSPMPNITVVNSTGVAATARMERGTDRMTLILQAAQMGANMAEARVNRSLRTGYGPTAQSVQRTYGLRRRA